MLIQCHGCGLTECLDLGKGNFDEQEKELNRVIDKGWRYFARIDMQDGRIHEAAAEYRGGSWSVFGGPLYEKMKVVGWWPLPGKMEKEA